MDIHGTHSRLSAQPVHDNSNSASQYYTVVLGRSEFHIDRRYTNLCPIGKGAYGLVASANDMITRRRVAIKRVSRLFHDLIDAKRILREIKLLHHLGQHDNIIEILGIMTTPPNCQDFHTLYIVTQLFECDLERIITSSQRLTDEHLRYFVYQILRGLKFIHSAHVLHRDLKPSNLLVNGNCDLAICDFGLARGIAADMGSRLTEYVMTRWYRAPELICDSECYGSPIDVWAVGCIFGELLGRKPLFKGQTSPQQLEFIIAKLGSPTDTDLRDVSAEALASIRRMPRKLPVPWSETFPHAPPLALDLLSKLLVFDQRTRISVDEALAHPYLSELHSRADEPVSQTMFDWRYEIDYPDEMPKPLLQKHMYDHMIILRNEMEALGYGSDQLIHTSDTSAGAHGMGTASSTTGTTGVIPPDARSSSETADTVTLPTNTTATAAPSTNSGSSTIATAADELMDTSPEHR